MERISSPVLPTRSIPSAVERVILRKESVSLVWLNLGLTDVNQRAQFCISNHSRCYLVSAERRNQIGKFR